MSFAGILWLFAGTGLIISFSSNRTKTKQAVKKAYKMFIKLLPMMAAIILVIGLTFAVVSPATISSLLGGYSVKAVVLSGLFGSISLIPMFIATPLAGSLLQQGAGVLAVAMFITTLNMVGILTAPIEKEFFGLKLTVWRNVLGYATAVIVAFAMAGLIS